MGTFDVLPDDLRDLLVALADAEVDFVVVGGWAMALHGRPRATQDLDVFVKPSDENARRLVASFAAFAPVAAHGVTPEIAMPSLSARR